MIEQDPSNWSCPVVSASLYCSILSHNFMRQKETWCVTLASYLHVNCVCVPAELPCFELSVHGLSVQLFILFVISRISAVLVLPSTKVNCLGPIADIPGIRHDVSIS